LATLLERLISILDKVERRLRARKRDKNVSSIRVFFVIIVALVDFAIVNYVSET
jgi:hypothetical protein